mmetsp:Transcript_114257/g.308663  ORF Transcript_114257/g.308663 Transcript_114257/m.308663 type:complete len:204 (-) Transcript_114257:6-617(-)
MVGGGARRGNQRLAVYDRGADDARVPQGLPKTGAAAVFLGRLLELCHDLQAFRWRARYRCKGGGPIHRGLHPLQVDAVEGRHRGDVGLRTVARNHCGVASLLLSVGVLEHPQLEIREQPLDTGELPEGRRMVLASSEEDTWREHSVHEAQGLLAQLGHAVGAGCWRRHHVALQHLVSGPLGSVAPLRGVADTVCYMSTAIDDE